MLCGGDGQLEFYYGVGGMNKDLLNGNGIDGFERRLRPATTNPSNRRRRLLAGEGLKNAFGAFLALRRRRAKNFRFFAPLHNDIWS